MVSQSMAIEVGWSMITVFFLSLYIKCKQPFFIKNLITHFWNNFYNLCCTSYLKEANLEALVFWGFRSYIEIQFSNTLSLKQEVGTWQLLTFNVVLSNW